ncbi:hypothetical protein K9U41_02055 [Xanthobacter autotrophicus]|nr:hypothetical protein [Xanthobacter autotrophicus]
MTRALKPMPIKIMADYGCHPLWWDSANVVWSAWEGQVGDIDPASLGVSQTLAAELQAWAERYDARLNRDDPGSTFVSPEDHAAFDAAGRSLARCLAQELGPRAIVRYWRDPVAAAPSEADRTLSRST